MQDVGEGVGYHAIGGGAKDNANDSNGGRREDSVVTSGGESLQVG